MLALLLAGCGSERDRDDGPTEGGTPPPTGALSAQAGNEKDAVGPQGARLRRHAMSGIEVLLVEVRRAGPATVTVRWRYRNTSAESKTLVPAARAPDGLEPLVDEMFLLDRANRRKYLVVRDAGNRPVGGAGTPGSALVLTAGQSLDAWAKFPAPPADVTAVSVSIPDVPTFDDVPILQ